MLYFATRDKARAYATRTGRQFVDQGPAAAPGKRWAVAIVRYADAA